MPIKKILEKTNEKCSKYGAKILAVSKTQPIESIIEAYNCRQKDFGENKVQELILKTEKLKDYPDINWHYIGHLQRNKVKKVVPIVSLIHAIDSKRLLIEVNKQSQKQNLKTNILIQIHIAEEKEKFGFNYGEAEKLLNDNNLNEYQNITIKGFMGMSTNTNDEKVIDKEFSTLSDFFITQKNNKAYHNKTNVDICILSMGMSNDYHIALKYKPTYVRLGTSIFGERKF